MNEQTIIERVIADNPQLHWASDAVADHLSKLYGRAFKAGPISHAVPPVILRYLAGIVRSDHLTIETGSGQTTVALAALARHHVCISPDTESVELIKQYMDRVGISRDKVRFVVEGSDTALPRLALSEQVNVAFIDGCHGYPFPAMDWHFIDLHTKIGGIVGIDNTEIPAVQNHCQFLEQNKTYRLLDSISDKAYSANYGASFYVKLKEDGRSPSGTTSRDAHGQLFNHRRVKKRSVSEILQAIARPKPKANPWD